MHSRPICLALKTLTRSALLLTVAASIQTAILGDIPKADGIAGGSMFAITEVSVTGDPQTKFVLRIAVKKRSNIAIDRTRVKIQVFFYDLVNDKDIRLTDANVTPEWLTRSHDWATSDPVILAMTYTRPNANMVLSQGTATITSGKKDQSRKPGANVEPTRRRYFGYTVRVYYDDHLQAARAEPAKLLSLFPSAKSQMVNAPAGRFMPTEFQAQIDQIKSPQYDVPPKVLRAFSPAYPPSRSHRGDSGYALVEFTINERGRTQDIRVLETSFKYYGNYAILAIQDWRFKPALKNGHPVSAHVRMPFYYRIKP